MEPARTLWSGGSRYFSFRGANIAVADVPREPTPYVLSPEQFQNLVVAGRTPEFMSDSAPPQTTEIWRVDLRVETEQLAEIACRGAESLVWYVLRRPPGLGTQGRADQLTDLPPVQVCRSS